MAEKTKGEAELCGTSASAVLVSVTVEANNLFAIGGFLSGKLSYPTVAVVVFDVTNLANPDRIVCMTDIKKERDPVFDWDLTFKYSPNRKQLFRFCVFDLESSDVAKFHQHKDFKTLHTQGDDCGIKVSPSRLIGGALVDLEAIYRQTGEWTSLKVPLSNENNTTANDSLRDKKTELILQVRFHREAVGKEGGDGGGASPEVPSGDLKYRQHAFEITKAPLKLVNENIHHSQVLCDAVLRSFSIPKKVNTGSALSKLSIVERCAKIIKLLPFEVIVFHYENAKSSANPLTLLSQAVPLPIPGTPVNDPTVNCVLLTTQRMIKLEDGSLVYEKAIDKMKSVSHCKKSLVRYDHLEVVDVDGKESRCGIWSNSVCQLFVDTLNFIIQDAKKRQGRS